MSTEGKLLGKNIRYPKSYCPEILVGVPRYLNRETYEINNPLDLFCGYDCWHAYEASFITKKGLPVAGVVKIVYSAQSNYIIESKSLKLYLSSFNMTPLGNTPEEGTEEFIRMIESDLSKLVQNDVKACFFNKAPQRQFFDFTNYKVMEEDLLLKNVSCNTYYEYPEYLEQHIQSDAGELKVCSHLLKSNCKITGQPDWGSIYIYMDALTLPHEMSLLKYIISLRNENHFHEEICEMTYKRLWDIFQPDKLMVSCLYTRRGGIDICPVRASHEEYLPKHLPQVNSLTQKTFMQ